jgi:hypothetical protein
MISDLLRPRLTDPAARFTAAAMVGVRQRGGNRDQKRDRLRISLRLACGLTPAQVAVAERCPLETIESLLEQEGFRELVEADRDLLAIPVDQQRARLVRLARIAIENALSDWDLGAACFVLKEEEQGRDPAVSVAEGIIARRQAPPPLRPPLPPSPPEPLATDHQPLLALVRRSEAGLRRAVLEEHAAQHAAVSAAPARSTAEAAQHALAMRRATPPPDPTAGSPAGAAATLPARLRRASRRLRRPP